MKQKRVRTASERFVQVQEVMETLAISKSKAYDVIKTLNKELNDMGKITISGKVSRQYFEERLYCGGHEETSHEQRPHSNVG